jgi:hypothetical protein
MPPCRDHLEKPNDDDAVVWDRKDRAIEKVAVLDIVKTDEPAGGDLSAGSRLQLA